MMSCFCRIPPDLQPGLPSNTRRNRGTVRTVQAKRFREISVDLLNDYTEPTAGDLTAVPELFDHLHRHVDGNGERHPHEATRVGVDLRVDADHLAVQVEQGARRCCPG